MTIGVGGSTIEQALAKLDNMTQQVAPISNDELNARLQKAQSLMQQQGIAAMYIDAGTNLTYFTGLKWYKSERLVGAILPAKGELCYVAPHFEQGSLNDYKKLNGEFFVC